MKPEFIAAIDIGTNSFHLLIVKILLNDFEVVYRERHILRLRDTNNSESHTISDTKVSEAIKLLNCFKTHSEKFNAKIYAVATSAMRDSTNREEVQKRIYESTGIKIEILSGDEEAELVYKASIYKKEIIDKTVLVFDLGGGSTEFILGRNQKILYKTSLQIGAVRFMQKYFQDYILSEKQIRLMREELQSILYNAKNDITAIGFDFCLGIGGTVTSLSWLIEKNIYKREHNFSILNDYKILREDFDIISNEILSRNSIEERMQIPAMESKRADIIPAGTIIINEIFSSFSLRKITAPGYSIKEGIVIKAIQSLFGGL